MKNGTWKVMMALLLACGLVACEDNDFEEAGENLDEAVEETGQAIEDLGDEIDEEF